MRLFITLCLASTLVFLGSCCDCTSPEQKEPQDKKAPEKTVPEKAAIPATDFSTAEAAAKTFIAAAGAENLDILSQCFSKSCEGEFKMIQNKTAKGESLHELGQMFTGATVTGTRAGDGPNSMIVDVKLVGGSRNKESLNMVKEGETWKVVGF